jgi:hypothetical protein
MSAPAEIQRLVDDYGQACAARGGVSLEEMAHALGTAIPRGALLDAVEAALSAETKLREEAERELGWYRAAHVLIANSDVFVHAKGDDVFFTDAVFKDGKPGLALNMNDVFFWGCADAEDVDYVDAPALLEIAKREGADGLVAYARDKRMARGETWDTKHLATYTPGLVTLDRARAAEARATRAEGALKEADDVCAQVLTVDNRAAVERIWSPVRRALAGEAQKEGTP